MNAPGNSDISGAQTLQTLMSPDGDNLVLLLGAPRSGTSWMAKIFDSHPWVLYRHEPDIVLRHDRIPNLCSREDVKTYREEAQVYLNRLMNVRTLKSAGSLPIFRKDYYGPLTGRLHSGMIYSVRAGEALSRSAEWMKRISIPDLVSFSPNLRLVMKSVTSWGRARLFAEALPKCRIVLILRHPCGQVASVLRGTEIGKFRIPRLNAMLVTEEAQALGLTTTRLSELSPLEQCAWHWTILNQKALNDLSGVGEDRVKVVRYEDACTNPGGVAKELFAFSGLDWDKQTDSFVVNSTSASDTTAYYKTVRNSLNAANRWRTSLSAQQQSQILDIATRASAGRMFASMT